MAMARSSASWRDSVRKSMLIAGFLGSSGWAVRAQYSRR
jgi:hypothetical protein